jgi:hypothetical protein
MAAAFMVVLRPFKRGRTQLRPGDVLEDLTPDEVHLYLREGLARESANVIGWAPTPRTRPKRVPWSRAWRGD